MKYYALLLVVLASLTFSTRIDPIWLSPTSANRGSVDDNREQFPERGVWKNITIGAGARTETPFLLMDSKKTLWIMFGTFDGDGDKSSYLMNVWNYDPKADLYRWVAGPGNTTTYLRNPGELRVPSPDNQPGGIKYMMPTIDHHDNIWFNSYLSSGELWMFNTTSYLFTRMHGLGGNTSFPSYGTQGQAGEDVWPGVAEGSALVTDSQNNLWLVGGIDMNVQITDKVWHFNTTSLLWTFISGNHTSFATTWGSPPEFGGRWLPGCDIDEDDRIWLFGGWFYDGNTLQELSDVWSFDTRTKQWRLEYGSNATVNNGPVIASQDFDAGNMPPGKEGATFVDRKDGTMILVQGGGLVANHQFGAQDDIWLFNKTSKQWKLIYGDPTQTNQTGNFTHYRVPGSVMPGRMYPGGTNGLNIDGDVFILGGNGDILDLGMNDMWLVPQDQCALNVHKCSSNAQCIEGMIGYSCQCNDGFAGDGFTCTAAPQSPTSVPAQKTPNVSSSTQLVSSLLTVSLVFISLLILAS